MVGKPVDSLNFFTTHGHSHNGCCLPWQHAVSQLLTRQWGPHTCSDYSHNSVLKLTETAISHVHTNKSQPHKGESFLCHLTLFYKSVTCS